MKMNDILSKKNAKRKYGQRKMCNRNESYMSTWLYQRHRHKTHTRMATSDRRMDWWWPVENVRPVDSNDQSSS